LRVTLDTNVLVSAFLSKDGTCADILDLVSTFEEIRLVMSQEILSEFAEGVKSEEVRSRLGYNEREVVQFEGAVRDVAEVVEVHSSYKVIKDDPDDDVVVNTALDGKAEYIISGDKHLKKLKRFREVRIVNPRTFMKIMTRRFGDLMLSREDFG
jgi:putative PIN family toxin of toxin-antitoxin system